MSTRIKNIIRSNSGCMLILATVRGIINKESRRKIVDIIFGHDSFYIKHLGEKNKNCIIYYIKIDTKSGFNVLYKNVLKYISYADTYGFIPVIEFTKDILYAERDEINGTYNPYEYYFVQPGAVSCDEAMKSRNVIFSKPIDLKAFSKETSYMVSNEEIKALSNIHYKYLRIRQELIDEFNCDINAMFQGKRVLGVHVRGTDFKKNYKNHPVYVTEKEYLKITKEEFDKGEYDAIFLATDENDVVDAFKEVFKDKLLFYECKRSSNEEAVHFLEDRRSLNKYLLGKEVLKDVYTLASCDAFIGGKSNVSIMARVVNEALVKKYSKCIILEHGLNNKGKILEVN